MQQTVCFMLLPSIGVFLNFLNIVFGLLVLFVREIENMWAKIIMTFRNGPLGGVKLWMLLYVAHRHYPVVIKILKLPDGVERNVKGSQIDPEGHMNLCAKFQYNPSKAWQ